MQPAAHICNSEKRPIAYKIYGVAKENRKPALRQGRSWNKDTAADKKRLPIHTNYVVITLRSLIEIEAEQESGYNSGGLRALWNRKSEMPAPSLRHGLKNITKKNPYMPRAK